MRERILNTRDFVEPALRLIVALVAAIPLTCVAISVSANAQAKDLDEFLSGPATNEQPAVTERREEHQTITDAFDLSIELSQDQALWTALAFEDVDQVRMILKRGANPNRAEELSLMTPLMAAETAPIAVALLQFGADPNARDRTGRTVLHHAVTMRDGAAIVPLLVHKGANPNGITDDGSKATPLFAAIDKYTEDKDKETTAQVIRALVSVGADVNASDGHGANALAVAATRNQPDLIRLLVDLGADPHQKLNNGRTPLDYARDANASDALRAFAELPAKVQRAN
jgi:ankyrin repeat protein